MDKQVWLGLLLDFYGSLLTQKQSRAMELYYGEDYSLAEIAEMESISRQGVRDALVRAEQTLTSAEQKLGIATRFLETSKQVEALVAQAKAQGDETLAGKLEDILRIWERD